jgi:hypothetical protein
MYKNKYHGKRVFILATGPSIKSQDLTLLQGEHCIAVSMFHLHQHINIIKPIWHVLAATHPPFKFDTSKIIFDTLLDKYRSHDINFLIGTTPYEYSYFNYLTSEGQAFAKHFGPNVFFANYGNSQPLDDHNYKSEEIWNIEKDPFTVRTVVYAAIQLAHHLGFHEIVLLGCDHDYLTDISRVENHHFYPESSGYSDKENLSAFTKERWFFEYYMRWKQYRLMDEYFRERGGKIINATEGGMLDVFPRMDLRAILNR